MLAWLRRRWLWVGPAVLGFTMIGGLAWWFGERAWWGWVDDQPLTEDEIAEIQACQPVSWTTGLKVLEQDIDVACPLTWFGEVMAPHLRLVGGSRGTWLKARLAGPTSVRTRWRAGSALLLAGAPPDPALAVWSRASAPANRSALADKLRAGDWPRGWEDPDLLAEVQLRGEDGAWAIGPDMTGFLRRRSAVDGEADVVTWVGRVGDGLGVSAALAQPGSLPPRLRAEIGRLPAPCPSRSCLRLLAAWAARDDHPDLEDAGMESPEPAEPTPLAGVMAGRDPDQARAQDEVIASWGGWIASASPEVRASRWSAVLTAGRARGAAPGGLGGRPEKVLEEHRGPLYTTAWAALRVGAAAGLIVEIRSSEAGLALVAGPETLYLDRCGYVVVPDPEAAPPGLGAPWPEVAIQALAAREAAWEAGEPEATVLHAWAANLDPDAATGGLAPLFTALMSAPPVPLPDSALEDRRRGWQADRPACAP